MKAGEFLAIANEFPPFQIAKTGDVIADEAVAALNETKNALALANPTEARITDPA